MLDRRLGTDDGQASGVAVFPGIAYNCFASPGLVGLREANMEIIVDELGHGWME